MDRSSNFDFGGNVKRTCVPFLIVVLAFAVRVRAQEAPSNDEFAPLVLVRIIAMPGVEGRFDHMAVDNRSGRIFAAVYEMIPSRFWMCRVAGESIALRIPVLVNPKWSFTFPIRTASWFPMRPTDRAKSSTPTLTN